MYNPQLLELVEMALMDGDLSQKEREIILRKAEKLGEDPDEVEMWLEGKLQQRKKELQSSIPPMPQMIEQQYKKSDKYGNIEKCPACGAIVQSLQTKCLDCGHDFRNIESVSSIKIFFREYQKIEDSVKVKESSGILSIIDDSEGRRQNQLFSKKKEFIMHFPIPNSKEDILEFLMLAVPLAKPAKKGGMGLIKKFSANFGDDSNKNWDYKVAEVWIQKCEQIIMKANFSMKEDKKTLEEIHNYAKELGIK